MVNKEVIPFVLDIGSSCTKFGCSGDDLPTLVFPTYVSNVGEINKTIYVGQEALNKCKGSNPTYPMQRGIHTNWDAYEAIVEYATSSIPNQKPSDTPILCSHHVLSSQEQLMKQMEILIEKFSFPAVYFSNSGALGMIISGASTGILVDSGEGVTSIVPIYEGRTLKHAVKRIQIGGSDVTSALLKLITSQDLNSGLYFSEIQMEGTLMEIKRQVCFVSIDLEKERSNSKENVINFELPDGNVIKIGNERFLAPDIMFDPKIDGRRIQGIHQQLVDVIYSCDMSLRRDLYSHVLFAGGNTMIKGFTERLEKELTSVLNQDDGKSSIKPRFCAPPNRDQLVWQGGSILAGLSKMQDYWHTKESYEEYGPSIVLK